MATTVQDRDQVARPGLCRAPARPGPGMKARSSARAVTAALAATVLVALAGAVLTGLGWSHLATSDAIGSVDATASAIAYAGLGALIVRRAGQPHRLAHAGRGGSHRHRVGRLGLRDRRHEGPPGRAALPGHGRGAGRIRLRDREQRPGRHLPGLPDRAAAVSPLAPGRAGRPGADRPDAGRVRGQHPTGGAARAGRHLAGLSQPARDPVRRSGGPARYPDRPGRGVRAAAGPGGGIAGDPVPPRRPAAAPADEVAGPGRDRLPDLPERRHPGRRGRPAGQAAARRAVHDLGAPRAARHPGGHGDRDLAAPAVRHRRDHQPRAAVHLAVGRA